MKKILLILCLLTASVAFASEHAPGLYLQVTEILDVTGPEPVDVWVSVTGREDALEKLPSVISEYFEGKRYTATLHWHYLDQPCRWEPLP